MHRPLFVSENRPRKREGFAGKTERSTALLSTAAKGLLACPLSAPPLPFFVHFVEIDEK